MAPRPGRRSGSVQVLSLGLPRTGSASLAAAYRILGYCNVQHGLEALDDKAFWDRLRRAAEATYDNVPLARGRRDRPPPLSCADWDEVWGRDAEVLTDLAGMFGRQLLAAYPDAKVVLCEPDIDTWYESFDRAFLRGSRPRHIRLIRWVIEPLLGLSWFGTTDAIMRGFFGVNRCVDYANAGRPKYREYYVDIKALVPPDRLLIYRLEDGWEPLCQFLRKPVPQGVEFPRIDEQVELERVLAFYLRANLAQLGYGLGAAFIVACVLTGAVLMIWRIACPLPDQS